MLEFYFHPSPNPMKVALLLEELQVPFKVVAIDIFKGAQHAAAFRALNPNGKVPVLVDDQTAVFDSHAILLHLAETNGRFLSTDRAERATTLSWLQLIATGLSPFSDQAVHFLHYAPESLPYAKNRYLKEVERHYRVLDERLAKSPFLGGASWKAAAACVVLAVLAMVAGCIAVGEARIDVISGAETIYVHQVPGDDVRYRFEPTEPFVKGLVDIQGFYVEVPLPAAKRPKRGKVPFDIDYRTWLGFRRTKDLFLDVDAEVIRYLMMNLSSGGWHMLVVFDNEGRAVLQYQNEGCIRWRYGLDGAPPVVDQPEDVKTIEMGSARSITVRPVLCQKSRLCSGTYTPGSRDSTLDCN